MDVRQTCKHFLPNTFLSGYLVFKYCEYVNALQHYTHVSCAETAKPIETQFGVRLVCAGLEEHCTR